MSERLALWLTFVVITAETLAPTDKTSTRRLHLVMCCPGSFMSVGFLGSQVLSTTPVWTVTVQKQ